MGEGSSGASGGADSGSAWTIPSKALEGGGEEALGGSSLRDSARESDGGGSLRGRLRSRLSHPSSLEDLPFSGVLLIIIRKHNYHLLSFFKGGWWGSSLDKRKRHGRDRRW